MNHFSIRYENIFYRNRRPCFLPIYPGIIPKHFLFYQVYA
nr:MAG TPA: hypothetical protein [Caudoviricetes sp.]